MKSSLKMLTMTLMLLLFSSGVTAQRVMERLDRGLVGVVANGGVFLSWRLLGNEPNDVAFNVYVQDGRHGQILLNDQPLTHKTCWFHSNGKSTSLYLVTAIIDGQEQEPSDWIQPWSRPYWSIPLQTPDGYTPNDASVGDLDGDGEYEIVLHQVGASRDNSQSGTTDPPVLEAYKMDGTFLWRINLGINIREGAHYTQFMVYDLDSDGRAEVACKTADGTVDGVGVVIGDAGQDYRNASGYILRGPEYLTVFNGLTGAALATTDYVPPRHPSTQNPSGSQLKQIWGDSYGNRCDRFLACIAYLDGQEPSLVMCRGYYTGQSGTPGRTVLAAWNWREGDLTLQWTFDTLFGDEQYHGYRGQGNHNLCVGDVDGDGKDEIMYGAMAIDHDGTGLYNTGLGHGDAMHLSDLDPARPGLEVFTIHEGSGPGSSFRDAGTGEVLWKSGNGDVGRGMSADIDPAHWGYECWGFGGIKNCKGQTISSTKPASTNHGIWWDGDLLRELLDGTVIDKWNPSTQSSNRVLTGYHYGVSANNGSKANPCLHADLLGDWREEVIWRSSDNRELRIFTTPFDTNYRFYTFMHDPVYRLSVAWQNVAYNQSTQTGFYMGADMVAPPTPNLIIPGDIVLSGYRECDFNDLIITLSGPGHYVAEVLLTLGFNRTNIASLQIPTPWQVTFYSGDHFTDHHVTLKSDQACLDELWMPEVRSISITLVPARIQFSGRNRP